MEELLYSLLNSKEILNQENLRDVSAYGLSNRQLLGRKYDNLLSANSKISVPKWKESLWDKNSVEPALLRVPIVIIVFMFLWALNILIFERIRLQYYNVLSIKTGKKIINSI
jgi:hypothetical protein